MTGSQSSIEIKEITRTTDYVFETKKFKKHLLSDEVSLEEGLQREIELVQGVL
jgi:hypothetical protein